MKFYIFVCPEFIQYLQENSSFLTFNISQLRTVVGSLLIDLLQIFQRLCQLIIFGLGTDPISLVVKLGRRSSKKPILRRFIKSGRTEIWHDCSSSKISGDGVGFLKSVTPTVAPCEEEQEQQEWDHFLVQIV